MRQIQKPYSTGKIAALAGLICLLVYLRALFCGFVNYDDPDYVLNNPLIRQLDPELLVKMFTEPYLGWWMPLTWISLAIDYSLWGLAPWGYHLTNIVLHSINTMLVVFIADSLFTFQAEKERTGCYQVSNAYLYPATLMLAGLLWGIHPLRVESVAWVTERKDVLFGFFALSSILTYLKYVEYRDKGSRRSEILFLSLVLFIGSLMSKSVVVVLPAVLLVMDWYPLRRFRTITLLEIALEKLPYAALSALMVFTTLRLAGDSSYLVSRDMFPLYERILVSGNGVLQYFRYMLLPAGITPYHIIPDPVPVAVYSLATGCVLCLFGIVFCKSGKFPWLTSSSLIFLLPLLPVLGLTQVGDQGFAARFTYLPAVAFSIMAAGLFAAVWSRAAAKPFLRRLFEVVVILVLVCYAGMSYRLITDWDNSETMWTRVISHSPSLSAYWNRAMHFSTIQNHAAAIDDYTSAIALATPVWRPHIHNMYAHRGEELMAVGKYEAAVTDLSTAINAYPHPLYFRLRAEALEKLGRIGEATADMGRAAEERAPLGWYF